MYLNEVVARSGLPKTTTHRLLGHLRKAGLVEHVDEGFYLGRKLFELGASSPLRSNVQAVALPFVQDLYEATHETVHLGVRDGYDIVYVEKVHGHGAFSLPTVVGDRRPLTCTAIGKALLAFSGSDLLEDVLSRPIRRFTDNSIIDARQLVKEIGDVRSSGIAYDRQECCVGCCCLGAPVLVKGTAAMALSVAVPSERFDPARLAPAVMVAAKSLSRTLGHLPGYVTDSGRAVLFGAQKAADPY